MAEFLSDAAMSSCVVDGENNLVDILQFELSVQICFILI